MGQGKCVVDQEEIRQKGRAYLIPPHILGSSPVVLGLRRPQPHSSTKCGDDNLWAIVETVRHRNEQTR
jgi:hypothetical protein